MTAMIISFADSPRWCRNSPTTAACCASARPIEPTSKRHRHPRRAGAGRRLRQSRAASTIEKAAPRSTSSKREPVELYIFSDGRFGDVEGFSLGNLQPEVSADRLVRSEQPRDHGVQHAAQRSAARRAAGVRAGRQLQRRASRRRPSSCTSTASCSTPPKSKVPAGDVVGAAFNLGDAPTGKLEAPSRRRRPTFSDRLALDNAAYAVLDPQKQTACCW